MCSLGDDGSRQGEQVLVGDLAAVVRERELSAGVRWVWADTGLGYPALLRAGVRVARCHDVALTESLLLGRDGTPAQAAAAAAAWDLLREAGAAMRQGAEPAAAFHDARRAGPPPAQEALFGDEADVGDPAQAEATLAAVITLHADQLTRIAADEHPARFGMLAAAESAGALAAAEMTAAGVPWQPAVHDELLTGLLGPRPAAVTGLAARSAATPPRPARLAGLAAQISAVLGSGRPVNPDSPAQVIRALAANGVRVDSTRFSVLRQVDHPAVPLLLEYKELSRLHAAFGWAWLDTWVSGGRFRPEYVVGGVVSGRWASRGGGALQIPKVLRRAVIADPGWVLVVADAAQLEPRVLAALAGDRAFAEAAAGGDLYAALAGAFGGDRAKAKLALLSAMYGGSGGEQGQLLAVLRRRFPLAARYVEAAARAGEEGKQVRSVLGRTCPAPSARWRALTEEAADPELERDPEAGRAARARGRFTRNFVVQASAADWALVLLAGLRARLARLGEAGQQTAGAAATARAAQGPHLVFFQHDEVIVHCPEGQADAVVAAVGAAAGEAARLVFGATTVVFPMTTTVVRCYADAK